MQPSQHAPARRYDWVYAAVAIALSAVAGATCSAGGDPSGGFSSGDGAGETTVAGPGGVGGSTSTFNPTMAGPGTGTSSGGNGAGAGHPTGCDTSCQAAGGTCNGGVCEITDNGAGTDSGTQMSLEAGGNADPSFRWLYPYDQTVFPRGLLSPKLQFDGASDVFYVHVTAAGLDYKGFFPGASPSAFKLPDADWAAITNAQGDDQVQVDVSKTSGGLVTGPITETWKIAGGSLRGTIYYETYVSQLAGMVGIMKIQPNATAPTVVKHASASCGCICHTASADGSTLVSAIGFTGNSGSWDLHNNAAAIATAGGNHFTYGGLYPDGSFVVSATDYRTWEPGQKSRLYDTHTGANIATPSWDSVITKSGTPAFSPDGKWIAFNHEDTGGGHSLAVMAYDPASKTFSGMTDVATAAGATLAWPAFTPDSKYLIYHAGSNAAFETDENATGDVYAVEIATKTVTRLDALDGYNAGGTYLPANDPQLSFAPTVLPEAVGGYFWIVFTSHRSYGNTVPSKQANDQDGKLWVAAFDLQPTPGVDPSHPAFFIEGQEMTSDNLRGFWVLDPCQMDGTTCTSGDQCCGGYCSTDASGSEVCGSTSMGCSHTYDHCDTSADCCDPGDTCINSRCAQPAPH